MNWRGIEPPLTSSTKSESLTPWERGDTEETDAELAVAAGLLLVLPLGLGGAGDRLAIRDLGLLGLDGHAELPFESLEGDGEVRLAHPPEQRLLRFAVSGEMERRILGEDAAECVCELVLVGLCLGGHRRGEDRLGLVDGRQRHRLVSRCQRVAGGGVGQLCDGDDVAGGSGSEELGLLADHCCDLRRASHLIPIRLFDSTMSGLRVPERIRMSEICPT